MEAAWCATQDYSELLWGPCGGCVMEGLMGATLGPVLCGLLWPHFGGCAMEGLVWAGVLKSQVLKIQQPQCPTGGEKNNQPCLGLLEELLLKLSDRTSKGLSYTHVRGECVTESAHFIIHMFDIQYGPCNHARHLREVPLTLEQTALYRFEPDLGISITC